MLLSSTAIAQKKVERKMPLGMEGALRVVNMVGSVTVHGWSKDTVLVRGALGAGVDGERANQNRRGERLGGRRIRANEDRDGDWQHQLRREARPQRYLRFRYPQRIDRHRDP